MYKKIFVDNENANKKELKGKLENFEAIMIPEIVNTYTKNSGKDTGSIMVVIRCPIRKRTLNTGKRLMVGKKSEKILLRFQA